MRSNILLTLFVVGFVFTIISGCNMPVRGTPLEMTASALPSTALTIPPVAGTLAGTQTPAAPGVEINPSPTPLIQGETPRPENPALSVAYVKDGNIWFWTAAGARKLTDSGQAFSPRLSSDGKIVAYLHPVDDYHIELWAVNTDSSKDRKLVGVSDLDTIGGGARDTSAVAINPYQFEWIPNTHTLIFNTCQAYQSPGLSLLDDFNSVNADSGEVKFILLAGWGGSFTLSPDGSQVAISRPTEIFLANVDGSNYRSVMQYSPVATYSEYRFYAEPQWAKDGKTLRVAIPPEDPLDEPRRPTTLWLIPSDGSPVKQEATIVTAPFVESELAYSPDLNLILYLKETGQPAENKREVHIARVDGSNDSIAAQGAMIQFIGWSPDSKHYLYTQGENQELWLGQVNGPAMKFSGNLAGVINVRWVDDTHILYVGQNAGNFEITYASVDGKKNILDTVPGQPPEYDFSGSSEK